jgi:hypothetical protein
MAGNLVAQLIQDKKKAEAELSALKFEFQLLRQKMADISIRELRAVTILEAWRDYFDCMQATARQVPGHMNPKRLADMAIELADHTRRWLNGQ